MTTATTSDQDQLLFDIFVTALEGGIQYWASVRTYHWEHNGPEQDGRVREDLMGFNATIEDEEEDDAIHVIDRDVLVKGWNLARGEWRDRIHWNCGEKPPIVVDEDGWDHDAGDADVIVQLGLFGEVVYG